MNESRKEGNGPLGGERPRGLFYVVPAGPKQCVVGFPQICTQGLPKWVPAGPISTCMDSHTLRSDKKRLRDKTVVDSFSFLIELIWWYRF